MSENGNTPGPRIVPLAAADDPAFGGKARGLARLIGMGLPVPAGFVVVDAGAGALPADLAERYAMLGGGPVAVRSSALGEDSLAASFAGQYETLLDVEGDEALAAAVERCLASLSSERAREYASQRGGGDESRMCVVVQRMVRARVAGVLFTADPVSGRRSRLVIDAVSGLGEELVAGRASPDHYVLDRQGRTLAESLAGGDPVLLPEDRAALAEAARAAEAREGVPLDLEWAIDTQERIYWLQARPITNLSADPTELDTPLLASDHVFTRCNVGEMFPGACTPLSFSFTARGIEVGLQRMHVRIGIQDAVRPHNRFLAMFHRNLFLNLTTMAETATQALGSSADQMALSVCGRPLDELEIRTAPPPPWPRRLGNGARYLGYLLGHRRARRRLRALRAKLSFEEPEVTDARERGAARYAAIDERFGAIHDAMDFHLVSSAGSGVLSAALLRLLAGGGTPGDEHHAEVAGLLAGARNVESADIASGAERVRNAILAHPDGRAKVGDAAPDAALAWLRGDAAGGAGEAFAAYLERHGHRTVKELELRQPEWREDPLPLVKSLQAAVRHAPEPGGREPEVERSRRARPLSVRLVTRMARRAVRSREETKSGLVDVTTRFKQAYRALGRDLAAAGLLPDADAVFFLTHEELGRLVETGDPGLAVLAVQRRAIHPSLDALRFPDVFRGAGEPEPPDDDEAPEGSPRTTGAPVSRGRVTGVARIVRRLEDAEALQKGEILIAPITDVGWTPYFSLIAGLVTDVGSAVSHGAVVAREYGLPAVVNTRNATRIFRNGDRVLLDGETGVVRLADGPPEP